MFFSGVWGAYSTNNYNCSNVSYAVPSSVTVELDLPKLTESWTLFCLGYLYIWNITPKLS